MPLANLDQLRAQHAHEAAGKTDRASVSKLPGMILTNGLLATLAFACEKDKKPHSVFSREASATTLAFACEKDKKPRENMKAAADSLAAHLSKRIPAIGSVNTGDALAAKLASGDALTLQRATNEALAYLTYLKRYAAPKDKKV